jgi:hypothetical protein
MRVRYQETPHSVAPHRGEGALVMVNGIAMREYMRDPSWSGWTFKPRITLAEPFDAAELLGRDDYDIPEFIDGTEPQ